MKKILISIIILWIKLYSAQTNCLSDVIRYSYYSELSVFNPKSGEYEKFTKAKETALQVIISSEDKVIKFIDKLNNYDKTFTITGCLMSEEILTYECLDNERKCSLIFSASDTSYNLIVKYEIAPIVYKVSRIKNIN